jgi:hypothetical protein
MGRSVTRRRKPPRLAKPRNKSLTSSHPRPVKITYMEGYGPEGKLKEPTDGHP